MIDDENNAFYFACNLLHDVLYADTNIQWYVLLDTKG